MNPDTNRTSALLLCVTVFAVICVSFARQKKAAAVAEITAGTNSPAGPIIVRSLNGKWEWSPTNIVIDTTWPPFLSQNDKGGWTIRFNAPTKLEP